MAATPRVGVLLVDRAALRNGGCARKRRRTGAWNWGTADRDTNRRSLPRRPWPSGKRRSRRSRPDIDKRETELKEREGLLRDAVVAAARDRDEIGALEVEHQCARYLRGVERDTGILRGACTLPPGDAHSRFAFGAGHYSARRLTCSVFTSISTSPSITTSSSLLAFVVIAVWS